MSTDECGLGWSVVEDVMCPSLIFSRLCLCCAAEKSEEKDKENQRSMHACRKKGKDCSMLNLHLASMVVTGIPWRLSLW